VDHGGKGRLCDEDRSKEVDVERRPDLARCERGVALVPLRRPDRMAREARRNVEAVEFFHDVGDKTLAGSGVRDVGLEGDPSRTELPDRANGCLGGLLPLVVLHPDVGALSRELEDRRATDASAAPGDQGDTPIESGHGVSDVYLWLFLMFQGLGFSTVGVIGANYREFMTNPALGKRYAVGFLLIADGGLHLLALNQHLGAAPQAAFFAIVSPIQIVG